MARQYLEGDSGEKKEGGSGGKKTEKERQTVRSAVPPVINLLVEEVGEEKKNRKKRNKPSTHSPVEVKATPGDCDVDESWNARQVLNTVDNTFKVFADGAWRTVVSW